MQQTSDAIPIRRGMPRRTPVGKATGRVKVGTVVFRHLQIALLATRNRITPIHQLRLVRDGADSFVTLEGKTPHLVEPFLGF